MNDEFLFLGLSNGCLRVHHLGEVEHPAQWRTDAFWTIPAHGPKRGAVNDILPLVLGGGTGGPDDSKAKRYNIKHNVG